MRGSDTQLSIARDRHLSCFVCGLFEMGILLSSLGYPSTHAPKTRATEEPCFVHGGGDSETTESPSLLGTYPLLGCPERVYRYTPTLHTGSVPHRGDMLTSCAE